MSRHVARTNRTSWPGATLRRYTAGIFLTLLTLASMVTWTGAQVATPPAAPQATPVAATPPSIWTQIGPDASLVARALVGGDCPEITIDGVSQPMQTRVGPNGVDFPDTVCETAIPAGTDSASIGGTALALLPTHLARIAVIGDTGCRIEKDWAQDCSDPAAWPFAAVAAQIAQWKPDLIIHVGDYLYREGECPTAIMPGCAGSPWGDNLAAWQADWFEPAAAALPVAPWFFVRGNHENCDRGGNGWFRYFAAGPMPAECQQFSPSWTANIDGRGFLYLDTSATADETTKPEIDAAFKTVLDQAADIGTRGIWLATHKPIAGAILDLSGKEQIVTNATLQSLTGGEMPSGIAVMLTGHVHLTEALSFERATGKPITFIVGNSGTLLDPGVNAVYTGAELGDPTLNTGIIGAEFGWTAIEIEQNRATVIAYRLDGAEFFRMYVPAPR